MQAPSCSSPYPRRADLEIRPLPMSAKPAKPISSIAHRGISGTDVAGLPCPVQAGYDEESPSGIGAGPEFGLSFGFPKSAAAVNAPSMTGGVTSQHADGKVPWIIPHGEVMAKLFCAAIISKHLARAQRILRQRARSSPESSSSAAQADSRRLTPRLGLPDEGAQISFHYTGRRRLTNRRSSNASLFSQADPRKDPNSRDRATMIRTR